MSFPFLGLLDFVVTGIGIYGVWTKKSWALYTFLGLNVINFIVNLVLFLASMVLINSLYITWFYPVRRSREVEATGEGQTAKAQRSGPRGGLHVIERQRGLDGRQDVLQEGAECPVARGSGACRSRASSWSVGCTRANRRTAAAPRVQNFFTFTCPVSCLSLPRTLLGYRQVCLLPSLRA